MHRVTHGKKFMLQNLALQRPLAVIDLETTGTEPPAEIIEFGRVDVVGDGSGAQVERPMARLYRPLNGIPPETMAIHHITEADFTVDTPV